MLRSLSDDPPKVKPRKNGKIILNTPEKLEELKGRLTVAMAACVPLRELISRLAWTMYGELTERAETR